MAQDIAQRFLQVFNHKKYTLCYFGEKGMRSFPCAPHNLEKAIAKLKTENANGQEIYFMVNEGNGELNEKKTACHSTKNVINLSSIFLDAELNDGTDPLPAVTQFCKDHFYPPSLVVETSPFRYHIYWLLEETEVDKESITKWKQIQALLHEKLSSDRTMTDISQILRVPAFKNVKKEYPVSVLDINEDHYQLDELYEVLQRNFPDITKYKAHQPLQPITEDYKVKPGERHEEMLRRAIQLFHRGIDYWEVRCYIDGFIALHLSDAEEFKNGKRAPEVLRILDYAYASYQTAIKEENQVKVTQAVDKAEKKKGAFELDPEFYYWAPGLVGELTRHIVDTAMYPLPSHAFAYAAASFGFTKARYLRSKIGLPPINYFLCLAPSGAGKTMASTPVKNLLHELYLSQFIEDGIASAQGMVKFLSDNKGLGLIFYDEVKDLFSTILSKRAASHEARIAPELNRIYTAYNSRYVAPTTKTQKSKAVPMQNTLLTLVGSGQPYLMDTLFVKENVFDGLLPRFLIFIVRDRTEGHTYHDGPVPSHIKDALRSFSMKSSIYLEEALRELDPNYDPNKPPKKEYIDYTPDAKLIYNQFEIATNKLYKQSTLSQNGLEALFSRGCEQVTRLALALSDGTQITAAETDFCTKLMTAQMQEFAKQLEESFGSTFHKSTQKLLNKIIEECSTADGYVITKRSLQQMVASWFDSPEHFSKCLIALVEQGYIIVEDRKQPSGQTTKVLRLGDVN